MTDDEIAQIEARANAATAGPWCAVRHDKGPEEFWCIHSGEYRADEPEEDSTLRWNRDDNVFIAHAREDLPKLIVEVRRLQKLIRG